MHPAFIVILALFFLIGFLIGGLKMGLILLAVGLGLCLLGFLIPGPWRPVA